MNARMRFWESYNSDGVAGLSDMQEKVFSLYPDHPVSRMMEAYTLQQKGNRHEAAESFRQLVVEYPESREIKNAYIYALERISNNTKLLEALDELINHGRLPSIKGDGLWQNVSLSHICEYADLLNKSARTRPQAIARPRRADAVRPRRRRCDGSEEREEKGRGRRRVGDDPVVAGRRSPGPPAARLRGFEKGRCEQ